LGDCLFSYSKSVIFHSSDKTKKNYDPVHKALCRPEETEAEMKALHQSSGPLFHDG
jgi:hypothetical protein